MRPSYRTFARPPLPVVLLLLALGGCWIEDPAAETGAACDIGREPFVALCIPDLPADTNGTGWLLAIGDGYDYQFETATPQHLVFDVLDGAWTWVDPAWIEDPSLLQSVTSGLTRHDELDVRQEGACDDGFANALAFFVPGADSPLVVIATAGTADLGGIAASVGEDPACAVPESCGGGPLPVTFTKAGDSVTLLPGEHADLGGLQFTVKRADTCDDGSDAPHVAWTAWAS